VIIVCTGISGVGKREYLSSLQQEHQQVRIHDVGERMLRLAEKLGTPTSTEKILDMHEGTLTALRAAAMEEFIGEMPKANPSELLLLATHACFRWRGTLTLGFNPYYLKKITKEAEARGQELLYVCFTDTVGKIWARLQATKQWRDRLGIEEILLWRDEEAALTKMIAQYEEKGFYLVPTEEPVQTLVQLGSDPARKKIYVAYPITLLEGKPDLLGEVRTFIQELRQQFIVFDPMSVQDIEWAMGKFKLPSELVSETGWRYIDDQTVARDYQLIDQSDMVVVYYKTNGAPPPMSFGVLSEMMHAYTNNKPVYALFPYGRSPFFKYYCTKAFPDRDSLLNFLSR